MASSIAAITTGSGGIVSTGDSSGNLNLVSGTTTIVAVTSAGVSVTGTLTASGTTTLVTPVLGTPASGNLANCTSIPAAQLTGTVAGTLTAGTSLVKNPYATSTQTVQAHGLATTPSFVVVILECLTIDAGWAVGDKLPISACVSGFNVTPSIQVFWDGTNVQLNLVNVAPGVLHKTSGSSANITVASWKITVVPYKLN